MEHYILEGVTDALFLDSSNYHNRITVKNIAGVAPRGVVYTLRSVLRGYLYPHKHTLRVSIYSCVGVYSVCSFAIGCGRPEEWDKQMLSTHLFYVGNNNV